MNRNKKRGIGVRSGLLLLSVLLAASLCGCRLAQESTGESNAEKGRLCGILVTAEPMPHSGEVIPDDEGDPDSRSRAEGRKTEDDRWVFDGVKGYAVLEVIEWENGERIQSSYADEGIGDLHFGINVSDEGEGFTLEATIYTAIGSDVMLAMNPVYQRTDGSVYALLHYSPGFSGDGIREGESLSHTIEESTVMTLDGRRTVQRSKLTLKTAVMAESASAAIRQMDVQNRLIREDSAQQWLNEDFTDDETDSLQISPDAAYILVEEQKITSEGKRTDRAVYSCDPYLEELEGHTFYRKNEEGVMIGTYVEFVR